MSVTCGFFNAVSHDRRYDAEQMSAIFNGIINDGIFMNVGSGMAVKANPGTDDLANMSVYIEPGRAWFNGTWTLVDAIEPLTLEASELVLDRVDTVVLEVNFYDEVRSNTITIVKGEPSTTPVGATLIDNEYVHQHALARIYVKAEVTQINQADITTCIGTSETPYITGILETINADDLLAQWQDQFDRWFTKLMADGDVIIETNTQKFHDWFERLSIVLDGDVASHLQNEIEHIFSSLIDNGNVIASMKQTFQDGVDLIYNACISANSTPKDISPNSIKEAIENITGEVCRVVARDYDETKASRYVTDDLAMFDGVMKKLNADGEWEEITLVELNSVGEKVVKVGGDITKKLLGTSSSTATYDIKSLYPDIWEDLTINNFSVQEAWSWSKSVYDIIDAWMGSNGNTSFSYDSTTGVLTVSPGNVRIQVKRGNSVDQYTNTEYRYASVSAYIHYCE